MKNYIRPMINYFQNDDVFSIRQYSDIANLMWLRNAIQCDPLIYQRFIYDSLESGVLKFDKNNKYLISKQATEVIKGFIFESTIVDLANNNEDVKKALYLAATQKSRVATKHLEKYSIIGTGLLSTKQQHPQFYNPGDSKDALFIRPNKKIKRIEPATIKDSTNIAPIQIKSIRSEKSLVRDILYKKMINRYDGVIVTCLMYDEFLHTKDKCIDMISNMKENRKININERKISLNKEMRNDVISSLLAPDDIYINQEFVNYYEKFIELWFNGASGLSSDRMYGNIQTALIMLNEKINGKKVEFGFQVENLFQGLSFT
ncbi:hypothetical protein FDF12_04060 [Clostridium botulinum]|nr:hypothetical protein [Clostridium botulinum]NFS52686.1 hypothetical protein [Clostridium botulinum]NFT16601.1 hypothetical protein [Clostridium botulinum]